MKTENSNSKTEGYVYEKQLWQTFENLQAFTEYLANLDIFH